MHRSRVGINDAIGSDRMMAAVAADILSLEEELLRRATASVGQPARQAALAAAGAAIA